MDPKKQDLNPELKQIYDRVMNTQVSKPQVPTTPAPAAPMGQTPAGTPPPAPPAPGSTPFTPPSGMPVMAAPIAAAPGAPTPPLNAARPIQETKSFVFTGNKVITPQNGAAPQAVVGTAKKGIPSSIIIVLVIVLIGAWGAFWAKLFGLF